MDMKSPRWRELRWHTCLKVSEGLIGTKLNHIKGFTGTSEHFRRHTFSAQINQMGSTSLSLSFLQVQAFLRHRFGFKNRQVTCFPRFGRFGSVGSAICMATYGQEHRQESRPTPDYPDVRKARRCSSSSWWRLDRLHWTRLDPTHWCNNDVTFTDVNPFP